MIPDVNFVLYLKEEEMRYILRNLNNKIKEKIKYLYNIVNYDL